VTFGSDPGYFGRHVDEHTGPERGNYYLSAAEHGEPPGQWFGQGAEALGLVGEVDKKTMETMYSELVHPVTGEALGARPYQFKDTPERIAAAISAEGGEVTPERRAEIELAVRKSHREARNYADATFSPPKSWSVLHTALESQGRHDDAEQVWAAWMEGTEAGIAYLQNVAGYSRAGRHGAKVAGRTSGRWVEAPNWVMSTWRHHTSRDGDPQLHVHVAILNRVQCDDGKWRSLDGQAITRARPAAGAIAERTAEESLSRRLGVGFAMRPDGKAREIIGISEQLRDKFSARRRAITEGVAELANAYQATYGREPSAYVLTLISEHVTLDTRKAKPDHPPTRVELLNKWENQARAVLRSGLGRVVESANVNRDPTLVAEAFDPAKVINQAIWEVQQTRATWTRHDLIAALNRELPDALGGLSAGQTTALLNELADEALSPGGEVLRLTAPELVPAPDELRRADGRSVYEPPEADRYATTWHLRTEESVVVAARRLDGPKIEADEAERFLATSPLSQSQAAAVREILTSGRQVEAMIGYAGVGKTFTMAELARIWSEATGTSALGLTTAERARHVLAEEGFEHSSNIARWLDSERHLASKDRTSLVAGQLVVVDEASMVTTKHLAEIVEIAQRAGAKVVLTGDDQQLSAVGSGGLFRLVTQEVEPVRLEEVRRFTHTWEREASRRLRDGDVEVLSDYDRRGRIQDGSCRAMIESATRATVAAHLRGDRSLLVLSSNELAAEVSSEIREQLVRLGRVETDGVILCDGNRAGVGDVITTRENDYSLLSDRGDPVVNRNSYVIDERRSDGSLVVRRIDGGPGVVGQVHDLPGSYVASNVELGYASTVHSAQGATVKLGGVVVDENMSREGLYVGASRGAEANTIYVITHDDDDHRKPEDRPDRFGVLASVLEREGAQQSASEVMREEIEGAESLARLEPMWADVVGERARADNEQRLMSVLDESTAQRLAQDKSLGNVTRMLRQAELAGLDPASVIEAVTNKELVTADSVATVLTWRIGHHIGEASPLSSSYTARTPEGTDAKSRWARELAEAMDRRIIELGEVAALDSPQWAKGLGPVPEEPHAALEWCERAGAIAAYREAHGYQSEHDAIGPAPLAGAVEARAAWQRAYDALGRPEAQRDLAGARDEELHAAVETYRREEAWAPPHVDEQLRDKSLSLDYWRSTIEITQAEIERDSGGQHRPDPEAVEQLHHERAAMHELEADVAALEEISEARAAWHDETREVRDRADHARRELRARYPEGDDAAATHDAPQRPDHDNATEPNASERRVERHSPDVSIESENIDHSDHDTRDVAGDDLEPAHAHTPEPVAVTRTDNDPAERSQIEVDLASAREAMARIEARRETRKIERLEERQRSDYDHVRSERDARAGVEPEHPTYNPGE
jgi:conjugative relaxase-like TrwC/TraI family protein